MKAKKDHRIEEYGELWAGAEVEVTDDHLVRVTIDTPLDDRDRVIIECDEAKAAAFIGLKVAGKVLAEGKGMKFLE